MCKSGEPCVLSGRSVFRCFLICSNSKLYHRAVGIIKDVAMVTESVAKNCLLRSIYEVDQLPSNINDNDITGHIEKATRMDKVWTIPNSAHSLLMEFLGRTCSTAVSTNITTLHCTKCESCFRPRPSSQKSYNHALMIDNFYKNKFM